MGLLDHPDPRIVPASLGLILALAMGLKVGVEGCKTWTERKEAEHARAAQIISELSPYLARGGLRPNWELQRDFERHAGYPEPFFDMPIHPAYSWSLDQYDTTTLARALAAYRADSIDQR